MATVEIAKQRLKLHRMKCPDTGNQNQYHGSNLGKLVENNSPKILGGKLVEKQLAGGKFVL